jgi:hypothetical protein
MLRLKPLFNDSNTWSCMNWSEPLIPSSFLFGSRNVIDKKNGISLKYDTHTQMPEQPVPIVVTG